MALGPTLINGFLYDFSQVEISIRGKRYYGISDISYKTTLENQQIGSNGVMGPTGQTLGTGKFEGSMSMSLVYADDFLGELSKCGGFMMELFDVAISYVPVKACLGGSASANSNVKQLTDVLYGCRIKGREDSGKSGSEAIMVKFDLIINGIEYNGRQAFPGAKPGSQS